jgi:hypothetical protein
VSVNCKFLDPVMPLIGEEIYIKNNILNFPEISFATLSRD